MSVSPLYKKWVTSYTPFSRKFKHRIEAACMLPSFHVGEETGLAQATCLTDLGTKETERKAGEHFKQLRSLHPGLATYCGIDIPTIKPEELSCQNLPLYQSELDESYERAKERFKKRTAESDFERPRYIDAYKAVECGDFSHKLSQLLNDLRSAVQGTQSPLGSWELAKGYASRIQTLFSRSFERAGCPCSERPEIGDLVKNVQEENLEESLKRVEDLRQSFTSCLVEKTEPYGLFKEPAYIPPKRKSTSIVV